MVNNPLIGRSYLLKSGVTGLKLVKVLVGLLAIYKTYSLVRRFKRRLQAHFNPIELLDIRYGESPVEFYQRYVQTIRQSNPGSVVTDNIRIVQMLALFGIPSIYYGYECNTLMRKINPKLSLYRQSTHLELVYDNSSINVPLSKVIEPAVFLRVFDMLGCMFGRVVKMHRLNLPSNFDSDAITVYAVCPDRMESQIPTPLSLFLGDEFAPTNSVSSLPGSISRNPINILTSRRVIAEVNKTATEVNMRFSGARDNFSVPYNLLMSCMIKYADLSKNKTHGVIVTTLGPKYSPEIHTAVTSLVVDNVNRVVFASDHVELPPYVFKEETSESVVFQPLFAGVDPDDAKPMNIGQVANPVVATNGFPIGIPMASRSTELDTFSRRNILPTNNEIPLGEHFVFADDFLREICVGALQPCTTDEVEEQMPRPTQKSNRDQVMPAIETLSHDVKKAFLKREPVNQDKPARNICTVGTDRLYRMARYTIPASKQMQSHKNWVWGLGSGATARRFHEVAKEYIKWIESDFSKFDASQMMFFTALNREMMHRWYPNDREEIDELMDDVFYQYISSSTGLRVNIRHGRFTGENNTTLFNTVDQMYIQYVSFRQRPNNPMTHEEAWAALSDGLYGGDDGITPDLGQDLAMTSGLFGMVVDVRHFNNDQPCRFLGRIYPAPGLFPDSYQDLVPFIKSLHLVNLTNGKSVEQGLVNMCYGLLVTDRNTPLINNFINSVHRAYPSLTGRVADYDQWWFKHYDTADPFILEDANNIDEIFIWTSQQLGCDLDDLYALDAWFQTNDYKVGSKLPVISTNFDEVKLKGAIEVDGVVYGHVTYPPVIPHVSVSDILEAENRSSLEYNILSDLGLLNQPGFNIVTPQISAFTDVINSNINSRITTTMIVDAVADVPKDNDRACQICSAESHMTENCNYRDKCRLCQERGHLADKCTQHIEDELSKATAALANLSPTIKNKIYSNRRPRRKWNKKKSEGGDA